MHALYIYTVGSVILEYLKTKIALFTIKKTKARQKNIEYNYSALFQMWSQKEPLLKR